MNDTGNLAADAGRRIFRELRDPRTARTRFDELLSHAAIARGLGLR
jgi:hypothetical protein